MLLDDFVLVYHFNEVHRTMIRALAPRVFSAIREVTPAEVLFFRILFGIRSLLGGVADRRAAPFTSSRSIYESAISTGFVLLAEATDKELVLGFIGQFWRILGSSPPRITNAEELIAFNIPGYAKAAINFYLDGSHSNHYVKLSTETRIYGLDPVARKKFAAYWWLIHAGSALTRMKWLRAIRQRAERI